MAKKYTGRSGAAARASGRNVDRPDIQARKSAAASMKSAGVQSLSGLSGSQGQVARFKTEQNQLRNEYNNKNTSDDRKEEIVKDLRGVSRNLNDQSRAAALNQVIREFGPGSVTNTGGIMGSDAGARFNELRGDFVGNQGSFKTGDKNLFKQVHPNPLKVLLGAATQIGNISPLGLVRNIEKIRTGQPLIDMSFMDRNKVDSPSRMKDFYSAYMEGMNKKIADLKSSKNADQFDAEPLDSQFQDVGEKSLDYDAMANEFFPPTGDPTRIADDKDLQEDMERSLLNQYSLLEDPNLADTLLDDTEETDLAEAINPESDAVQNYEEEFINTYGPDSAPFQAAEEDEIKFNTAMAQEGDPRYMEGGEYDVRKEIPGFQSYYDTIDDKYPYNPANYRRIIQRNNPNISYPDYLFQDISQLPEDFLSDKGITAGRENFDTAFQDVPFRTDNIPAEAFDSRSYLLPEAMSIVPKQFKDGGSVNTYDVLKLINDTMNDG